DKRLEDVLLVLENTKTFLPNWNGDFYILGGSEGGLLASMVAQLISPVKTVLLVTGGGLTLGEAILKVQEDGMKAQGVPPDVITNELNKVEEIFDEIRVNPSPELYYGGEENTYLF